MIQIDEKTIQSWVNETLDKTLKGWETGEPVGVEFDIDDFKLEIIDNIVEIHNIELSEDDMYEFETDCKFAIDVYLGKLMVERLCTHVEGSHWMIYLGEE